MIHSVKFKCILDTNVIYPIIVRDILLWFAHYDLFTPKWSDGIFSELETVMDRKGIEKDEIARRINLIHDAFPDAKVQNYHGIMPSLELPDEKDKHVLAAAIKTNANVIVTYNLVDFPDDYISSFSLSVKDPDDFLTDIIDLNHGTAVKAFREMVLHKRNPDLDEYQVLDQLRNNNLKDTADYLHSLL